MKLQGRNLSANMTGDDVALLHVELQKLGFRIPTAEFQKQRFGRQTGEAIRAFQIQHHLPVTGKVDERTATLINRDVDKQALQTFVVSGKVKNTDNEPLSVVVRAFDKDLRAEQLLGEARTDAQGQYRVEYSADQFARAEKINADLIVRAIDEQERQLAASGVLFNAPPEATIDLIAKPPVEEKLSEFERLIADLQPLLDGVPLAELTSEDIAFLVGETGLERERLIMLARSAQLARETNLPTEVFYGLARLGLKLELDKLLREKREVIRKTLQTAIRKAIIPAAVADSLDNILERWRRLPFEQGLEVVHELFVELLDEQTKTPLADFGVNAFDLDGDEGPKDLGATVTDGRGRFAVSYTTPKVENTGDVPPVVERHLQFVVTPPDEAPVEPVEITITVGNRDIIPVLVAIPAKTDDTPTLAGLKDTLALPDVLIDHLAAKGIESLDGIRAHGGIAGLKDLPVSADDPAVRLLDAHANLYVVSDNIDFNQKLINNGLTSWEAIAKRPRSSFVSLVNKLNDDPAHPVGDLAAARLHAEARGVTHFLNNVVGGLAAEGANGTDGPASKALPALAKKFASKCACRDCESAVSPLAYLTDLLDYVTTHLNIESNGAVQALSLENLDDQFHKSFSDFSVDCDLVEKSLPQVRLCTEVLRSFVGTEPSNEVPGEAEYRLSAYRELLAALETSYEELRAARSDDEDTRKRLADRLGIEAENLDDLPLDLEVLTEGLLERLFGLPDTTRDVLSQGAKTVDSQDQLKRWYLLGAEWHRNTDELGQVHLTLSRPDPGVDRFVVEVFRDHDRTELVAIGERASASGTVILTPENNSHLHGVVDIDFSADGEMVLSLVPLLLSRRYAFLRDQWHRQDHPVPPDDTAIVSYPLIDPDLIGPADLRSTETTDPAFQLWQARRQQLEVFLTEIKDQRQSIGFAETIHARLEIDVAELEDLRGRLEQGEADAINDLRLLGLEPASLNRLLALVALAKNNAELLDQELDEFDAILLQARKVTQFVVWRAEERQANITLSPDYFQVASEEPEALPLWRATRSRRRDWQRRLKGRIEQEQAVQDQMYEAVGKVEQAALSMLRDALLLASGAGGDSLEAKAEWVTRNLLIDARADSCMRTTRIAQAIETLQGLVESARRGTAPEVLPTLRLDADDFEGKWQWLGSYETWRAAMLLFLYPENLLLPSLRAEQTAGFKRLIETVRDQRRLTPEQACNAAHQYAQYFQDICTLRVETSCRAKALIHKDDGCRGRVPVAYRDLDYFFGRGSETQAVYWSSTDPRGQCGRDQSYWAPVPNLENVEAVIGAVPYRVTLSESYICLFVEVREDDRQQLILTRYRLEQQLWDEEPVPLDLPERNDRQPTQFSAVARQRGGDVAAPHLAIFVWDTIFDRKINRDATGWDEENAGRDEGELLNDWGILAPSTIGRRFERVWSMVHLDGNNYYLLVKNRNGELQYRLFGPKDDGYWHPQYPEFTTWRGEPVGAFRLGSDTLYAFWKEKRITGVALFSFPGVIPETNPEVTYYRAITAGKKATDPIENFKDFDKWLGKVAGLSLSPLSGQIGEGKEEFSNLLDFFTQEVKEVEGIGTSFAEEEVRQKKKAIRKAAKDFGEKFQSGEFGWVWRWVDFMVRQTSNANSLSDMFVKLVEKRLFGENHLLKFNQRHDILTIPQQAMSGLEHVAPAFTPSVSTNQIVVGTQFADIGAFRTVFTDKNNHTLDEPKQTRLTPLCCGPFNITEQLSDANRAIRRQLIKKTFGANDNGPISHKAYIEEAYYFVPVYLALQLCRRSQYESALDWFRTIYDYTLPDNARKIYYGLIREESLTENYKRAADWLDPLNPHAIAVTRANSYTRFTQLSIIQCLLDYADTEFARDSVESVARARTLYLTALELLDSGNLGRSAADCQAEIDDLDAEISTGITNNDPQWQPLWNEAKFILGRIGERHQLESAIKAVRAAVTAHDDFVPGIMGALKAVTATSDRTPTGSKVSRLIADREQQNSEIYATALSFGDIKAGAGKTSDCLGNAVVLGVENAVGAAAGSLANIELPFLREPAVFTTTTEFSGIDTRPPIVLPAPPDKVFEVPIPTNPLAPPPAKCLAETYRTTPHAAMQLTAISLGFTPSPSMDFCVPQNPIPSALRLHAQLNLFKIRNCRNIAGDERALEPYAAPVDVSTGLPSIGSGGEIVIPRRLNLPPTPYRYSVLVDRAKQLVGLAQQMEAAFLSALEKHDAEFYNLIRARQEVRLARSGVRLQDLRVNEAADSLTLAELQRERTEIQEDYFQDLLEEPISVLEYASLGLLESVILYNIFAGGALTAAAATPSIQSVFSFGATNVVNVANASSAFASAASTQASILSTLANYERRKQEWQYQRNLAMQDVRIGSQQIKLAKDRTRVVGQERTIADIQAEHANQAVEFLANKFTNAELYEFMSEVLEGVYSYFLQQATSVARLAERQIAFERQEVPPPMIQSDYWEAPLGFDNSTGIGNETSDRRGITGSARLLQDITKLDQFAFQTDGRKLQLSKTLSLARLAPAEFQRFRETGVMLFNTPLALFDQDFPGHYLRLIKRVRTSLIALIPPVEGIKATLTTTGISRVVTDAGGSFQTVNAHRLPESVALTSPRDATGLFELLPQSQEKLFPFEGMGVDTAWEFQLPKAANFFDYSTIADFLVTIEYTALNSFDYRRQVIKRLDQSFSADRPLSFRHEFADQWYELNNPEQADTPMVVSITTRREDFPPNLEELKIQHLVLFFSLATGATFEVPVTSLTFKPERSDSTIEGGGATTNQGVISTRRGNAGDWAAIVNEAPSPFGTWTLSLRDPLIPFDPSTPGMTAEAFKNEKIEDILFVITYRGLTPEWPA